MIYAVIRTGWGYDFPEVADYEMNLIFRTRVEDAAISVMLSDYDDAKERLGDDLEFDSVDINGFEIESGDIHIWERIVEIPDLK